MSHFVTTKVSYSSCHFLYYLLIHSVAARVMSETRTYRKVSLQMSWVEERSGTSESDSDDESNQIEVHDVPSSVTEKTLKAYFEVNKSGGCKGAVSDCKQIKEGVFVVTFFSHEGMQGGIYTIYVPILSVNKMQLQLKSCFRKITNYIRLP